MTRKADIDRVREARRLHAEELLGRPGVVSVGVGFDEAARPALVVGAVSAEAAAALALPAAVDGVPVIVRVVGRLESRE